MKIYTPDNFALFPEFNLSEKQAEAILDISLRRLTLLEVYHNSVA